MTVTTYFLNTMRNWVNGDTTSQPLYFGIGISGSALWGYTQSNRLMGEVFRKAKTSTMKGSTGTVTVVSRITAADIATIPANQRSIDEGGWYQSSNTADLLNGQYFSTINITTGNDYVWEVELNFS